MLGYIKTDTAELRVREERFYRALYCGLCKRMGKCTGNCSRMTLSYDFVFLAAVRLAVTGEKPTLKPRRCLLHPFRRRPMAERCDALDFSADASALLTYRKLDDDLHDERGLCRFRARIARLFLGSAYRKAKRRHPSLDTAIAGYLEALSRYEKQETAFASADAPAEQFGCLMEAVFSEGLTGAEARIAGSLGRAIGHWIYLADAADDFAEDCKRDRFNPYRRLFGEEPQESDRENLRLALTALLCQAEQAFLLLDDYPAPELQAILANILYLGLPATATRVCARMAKEEKPAPSSD